MAEPSGSQASDAGTPKFAAPKDKNCPYCGQAFTSSSLGRHLDLYIKEKNPKPPDGIHDVEAIKKMRGGITRRQPRASLGGKREVGSTPTGTPRPSSKKETPAPDSDPSRPAGIPRDGQYAVDSTLSKFPFVPRWEATGVINDIPARGSWDSEATPEAARRPPTQRGASKQVVQKAQFDVKQKLADAMDTARAAELALREILSSWRSAKQEIDNGSMPFEFDPLALDFPALTVQCLEPPPTLFSSTQHPTSTSWSVQAPAEREFIALQSFFEREFRAWKVTCASATTAFTEELVYPPTNGPFRDVGEAVKKAERTADHLEKQVAEHLQSAYTVWESLPEQRRTELWVLELARGVGRKNKDVEKMKAEQHRLRQENTNLKAQVDQLNRLQQPREFKLLSPSTFPIDRDLVANAYEQGVRGGKSLGFDVQDRKHDLGTVVTKAIERWKSVITSTRVSATGMSAQKSLDQAPQSPATGNPDSPLQSQATPLPKNTQSQPVSQQSQQQGKRLSTASANEQGSEQTNTSNSNTAPPSVDETSDQDADAEMEDDDSFAIMHPSPIKQSQPLQQGAQLDVPRTRGQAQQQGTPDMRYMMQNGATSPSGRHSMPMSRSMPNMNMGMQGGTMQDMGMPMQGVRGDMYME